MNGKAKISAKGTYVLDENDLDQQGTCVLVDPAINELLESASSSRNPLYREPRVDSAVATEPETVETTEDLIAPEILFPELER